MTIKLYIPQDTTALSLDADRIAQRFEEQIQQRVSDRMTLPGDADIEVVRNGSRGMFWLEPLVEIDTPQGRVGYGCVTLDDVDTLLEEGILAGEYGHRLCVGLVEELDYFKRQQRLIFARAGLDDPLSLTAYRRQAGFDGLAAALAQTPQQLVDAVKASGLRGRGGAAFPTGIKWQTVLDAESTVQPAQKYIVCNADEGDSGTFADRLVMEADPYMLIEGMIIAGLAVGANQGYIYLRQEYPEAYRILSEAINRAQGEGILGDNILGSGRAFHLQLRLGAGAYICGEETSLLESLEGKRALVRAKPPLPAIVGLFGQPTVVNNVLTLATIPYIFAHGAQAYADYGMGRSRGSLPFQLAGNIKRGGVVELAFGASLDELLFDFGGGSASGLTLRTVQVGGPLGAYMPRQQWSTVLDYEAFAEVGAVLGHGGIVAFDETVDMAQQARFAMEFCVVESCGKCTPCRIGSTRGVEVIDKITVGNNPEYNWQLLDDLCDTLEAASLCAMGGMTPNPVRSAMQYYPADFTRSATTAVEDEQHA